MKLELQLRPHQEDVLTELRRNWKQHRCMVVSAPTGFGKTAVAARIAASMIHNGKRVLMICPLTVLVTQTAERFVEYGLPEPGIIWRDMPTDPLNPLQIASAQTLIRRDMPDVDAVLVDESHLRFKKLLEIMADSSAHWIGLTATPYAKWMGQHYEKLIKVTTMKRLIEQGYLSKYDVYAPDNPSMKGVKTSNLATYGQDYKEADVAEIMGEATIVGNVVQNWLENGENQPTICFAVNVSHANFLTVEFGRAGINAEVMTAETPHDDRQETFKRFRTGQTKILVNVGVLCAGFDEDVRCLIYCRPTKSSIRWVQSCGRAVRTAPGKEKAVIFDHSGTVHRLGFPCDIEYDELPSDSDGMDESKQKREREKKEKLPTECPKCHRMKEPGEYKCLNCGFAPINGDDVETDESRGLTLIKGKKRTREDSQAIYSMLYGYRKERQLRTGKLLSDGWVSHTYKEITGVWPRKLSKQPIECSQEIRNIIKAKFQKWAKQQA